MEMKIMTKEMVYKTININFGFDTNMMCTDIFTYNERK